MYLPVGETVDAPETPVFDVEASLRRQETTLEELRVLSEKDLFWRRVSAGAAIAGVVIGLAKLGDILLAIQRRRREEGR